MSSSRRGASGRRDPSRLPFVSTTTSSVVRRANASDGRMGREGETERRGAESGAVVPGCVWVRDGCQVVSSFCVLVFVDSFILVHVSEHFSPVIEPSHEAL